MSTSPDLPIVVGVNGSLDADRAVHYAVRRAREDRCGIVLVNAVHEIVPVSPLWPLLTADSLLDVGREILAEAQTLVEKLSGARVPVETVAAVGPAVAVIADTGRRARLVVLGHRGVGAVERFFTGATTLGVAARATCPVVSVPHTWQEQPVSLSVVAAVDGSAASSHVLAAAFARASARGARLEVVHCWELDPLYSSLMDGAAVSRDWSIHTSGLIAGSVAEWSQRFPEVEVEIRLRYADLVTTLVACSEDAEVLVVGRHGHGGISGRVAISMPGSTARALIEHARCPVELVPVTVPADDDAGTGRRTAAVG